MSEVYNPLDKRNLGKSIVDALLLQSAISIDEILPFDGAGIYAIYYFGDFPAYEPISAKVDEPSAIPIYVGKAIPKGARRGASLEISSTGNSLFSRLRQHRESLNSVSNSDSGISAGDFWIRYLVVDDIWIPLGEALMIAAFNPVWNVELDGFGNHDPGKGRYQGLRPKWDVVHPGRAWAEKCAQRQESKEELITQIFDHFNRA
ncbi:MAG: Eco29kI family restriction endonuclease [Sphingomonadales bacterium]|nr:Eco29kI family restriction endonuclease [Sphingomonadales bacterium]